MVLRIGEILGRTPKYKLVDFHSSRPGHDLRYALDGTRLRTMGWDPPKAFDQSLRQTVEWTTDRTRSKWLSLPSVV